MAHDSTASRIMAARKRLVDLRTVDSPSPALAQSVCQSVCLSVWRSS